MIKGLRVNKIMGLRASAIEGSWVNVIKEEFRASAFEGLRANVIG